MKQHPVAPYRSIRASADPGNDIPLRALIFDARMPERAFYYGPTAAAMHGLPLPARLSDETLLHVAVEAGVRRLESLGVVPHHVRITPADLVTIRGVRATSIERTWCDLAACGLTVAELVAAGDRALWRRDPRTTRHELNAAVARYDGRRGIRLMRGALPLLSDASDSAAESELRVAILEAGFPAPDVNAVVRVGGAVIHPDLSWPSRRVAIEYEGDHHRTDRDQWNSDIRRQTMLNDAGWSVYRATAEDYRSAHRLLLWLARRLQIA